MDETAREREKELALRARQGDQAAFTELVALCGRSIHSLLYRLTQNAEDAKEMTQATLVKAFLAMDTFRGEAAFRTWVHRIAVNTWRNAARDRARKREVSLDAAPDLGDGRRGAEDSLERAQEKEQLWAGVRSLPPRQQEALTLRVQSDHTFSEVAGIMGCTVGAAKAHYHLAVRRLRRDMNRGQS